MSDKVQIKAPKPANNKDNIVVKGFHSAATNPTEDELLSVKAQVPITDNFGLAAKAFQGRFHNFQNLDRDKFLEGRFGANYRIDPGTVGVGISKEQFNEYNPKTMVDAGIDLNKVGTFNIKQNVNDPRETVYGYSKDIPIDGLAGMLQLKADYNTKLGTPEYAGINFTKHF